MFQKKRSQRRKQLIRHYLKRAYVVLVLGAIGVLLYYGLQSDAWDQLNRNISSVSNTALGTDQPAEEAVAVVDPREKDFQDFLEKSTPQRLILRSTELIDNEGDDLLVRLDRQKRKIRIADSLLRIKNDARSSEFGTLSKLKALRKRELINLDHGLTTEESVNELHEFAYRSTGSTDEEVAEEAQFGKFFARLVRAIVFGDSSDNHVLEPALREFKLVSKQRIEDADIARELYGLLERIHVRAPRSVSRQFVLEFARVFQDSPSSEIRKLAESAEAKIIENEFEFVDVFGSLSVDKNEVLNELSQQIRDYVERPFISAQGFRNLLIQIQVLGAFGRYDVAIDCVERLQRRLAVRESLLPMSREAYRLRKKYRNAGEKFDFSLVKKVSSDAPFQVRFPAAAVKGLYFFDANTVELTTKSVAHIMGIAGKYIPRRDFCFALIMLDEGNNEKQKNEFRQVEKLMPGLDTGIIDVRTEEGKKFVDKYVLQKRPHLLLLDGDGRIAAVSVVSVDFERRFFEILRPR